MTLWAEFKINQEIFALVLGGNLFLYLEVFMYKRVWRHMCQVKGKHLLESLSYFIFILLLFIFVLILCAGMI